MDLKKLAERSKTTRLHVRIDSDLLHKVQELIRDLKITKTTLIETLLRDFLEVNENEVRNNKSQVPKSD